MQKLMLTYRTSTQYRRAFLDIPREIRDNIYGCFCGHRIVHPQLTGELRVCESEISEWEAYYAYMEFDPGSSTDLCFKGALNRHHSCENTDPRDRSEGFENLSGALLFTCKTISQEVLEIIYKTNVFGTHCATTLTEFLGLRTQLQKDLISNLQLTINFVDKEEDMWGDQFDEPTWNETFGKVIVANLKYVHELYIWIDAGYAGCWFHDHETLREFTWMTGLLALAQLPLKKATVILAENRDPAVCSLKSMGHHHHKGHQEKLVNDVEEVVITMLLHETSAYVCGRLLHSKAKALAALGPLVGRKEPELRDNLPRHKPASFAPGAFGPG